MTGIAWQMIRRAFNGGNAGRNGTRRPMMKLVKETHHTSVEKSTTRDELKLVCRRIADIDALWRSSAFPQATTQAATEKRAA